MIAVSRAECHGCFGPARAVAAADSETRRWEYAVSGVPATVRVGPRPVRGGGCQRRRLRVRRRVTLGGRSIQGSVCPHVGLPRPAFHTDSGECGTDGSGFHGRGEAGPLTPRSAAAGRIEAAPGPPRPGIGLRPYLGPSVRLCKLCSELVLIHFRP